MYREKLVCDAEGRPWEPSSPDPNSTSSSNNNSSTKLGPSSTGSLRKPRTSNLASSGASSSSSGTGSPATVGGVPSKVQNEDYFARMGAANDSRPDHLPPSQGGKYGGFGSGGPGPAARGGGGGGGSANPLSSRNLPGIDDLRDDPMGALNKGWGFLGAALGAVGKTVNE
jgi:ADP-ribosylation factor GTPase-activating protein 1